MTPDQETKCRVVAEKIMNWVPATEWAGGTEVVGWIDSTRHHKERNELKAMLRDAPDAPNKSHEWSYTDYYDWYNRAQELLK